MRQTHSFFGTLFSYSGLASLARRVLAARGRFVLEFHGVARRRYPELPREVQPSFTARGLEATLDWVFTRFKVLSASEFFETDRPGVLLTFDDGFANHAEVVLPILSQRKLPAILFLAVQHVRNPTAWLPATRRQASVLGTKRVDVELAHDLFDGMSEAQLRVCAATPGIEIGSHSVTHPFLTQCGERELRIELRESKRYLEEITGRRVGLLAYPSGDYDERVVEEVRASRYAAAFAEDPKDLAEARYEIPRVGLYSADPSYLSAKLSGLHRVPLRPTALDRGVG